METDKTLIKAKGVYLGGAEIPQKGGLAFGGVDLKINAGEFVVFFGPAGSGNSKMLWVLAGLSKPKKGEVLTSGFRVGVVPGSYALISTLSVLDNVALPLAFKGLSRKVRYKMAAEILGSLGMTEKMYDFPQDISKKEEQLAAIARSLIVDPDVIFLDDPVKKLGLRSSKILFDILHEQNSKRKRTIVVALDDSELFYYADRIFFFRSGKMIKEGINAKRPESFDIFNEGSLKRSNADLAVALADNFLGLGDADFRKKLEDLILKRLEGRLSDGGLEELLKRSQKDGGVGLLENSVQALLRRVDIIFYEREVLKKEQKKETVDIGELRKRVLAGYSKKLSMLQISRLEEAVERFLGKIINDKQFKKILSLPEIQGGIGFSYADAKKILLKLNSFFRK